MTDKTLADCIARFPFNTARLEITAVAPAKATSASVADDLLRCCAREDVDVHEVIALVHRYLLGEPVNQPCSCAASARQQQDPVHDQSAFK